jgi:hypothetical protein
MGVTLVRLMQNASKAMQKASQDFGRDDVNALGHLLGRGSTYPVGLRHLFLVGEGAGSRSGRSKKARRVVDSETRAPMKLNEN